jgi:hypothetical protein
MMETDDSNIPDNSSSIDDESEMSASEHQSSETVSESEDDMCYEFYNKYPKFAKKKKVKPIKDWRIGKPKDERNRFAVTNYKSKYYAQEYTVLEYLEPYDCVLRLYNKTEKVLLKYLNNKIKATKHCLTDKCMNLAHIGNYCKKHMTDEGKSLLSLS